MSAKPKAPRGTRDVLPEEGRLRLRIIDVARRAFEAHGYGAIVTPTFEDTEVFARGVGEATDIVRKEMYTFQDASGRSLTLRPEGTAPVARAFVSNGMHKRPLPAKLWYVAPMFRYEAPQSGRYREHHQVGAEALGSDDPLLDVEAISLLRHIYSELHVPDVRLRLGDMGDAESRGPYRRELLAYLSRHEGDLPAEARERMAVNPLRLFDAKDEATREIMRGAPLLIDHLSDAAAAHRAEVLVGLDALGIEYEVDPTLVRGLDYYTNTVFEFTCDRLGAQSGIGGGGRYDGLVESLGGPPTPGVGFGSGIERITLALEGVDPPGGGLDCYVAVLQRDLRPTLLARLAELRSGGLRCEMGWGDRSLKSMMRQAAALGARTAVIVGPREAEQGIATVRDMDTGDQRSVSLNELTKELT
ncbi:MAG: histidine--tRNA ligase [Miltoncostaeaceae bacterium]